MAAVTYTNAWKNLLAQAQMSGVSCQALYVAAGTGTGAPASSDTQLGAEVCRVPILSITAGASPGEYIALAQIDSATASGTTFKEFGLFGGSTATSSANTGTLVGRFLTTQAHSGNVVQVQFDLTGS